MMMRHTTNAVMYSGVPQDDVYPPDSSFVTTKPYRAPSFDKKEKKGVTIAATVFIIVLIIIISLAIALPIVYARKEIPDDNISDISDDPGVITDYNENDDVNGSVIDLPNQNINLEFPDDSNEHKFGNQITTINPVVNETLTERPKEDENVAGEDDKVDEIVNEEDTNSELEKVPEKDDSNEQKITTLQTPKQDPSHANVTNEDIVENVTPELTTKRADDELTNSPKINLDTTTEQIQESRNITTEKSVLEESGAGIESDNESEEPNELKNKIQIWVDKMMSDQSTTVAFIAAAVTLTGVLLLLVGVMCTMKRNSRRNRKVTIQDMVTGLQSPDKVILLNAESSEED